mgnify:CR=1 FL=1
MNLAATAPIPSADASLPPWPIAKRIAFRIAFVYLVLYSFPFPLNMIPGFESATIRITESWQAGIKWVGQIVFGAAISTMPNGSGDTTYNYVEVFTLAIVSLLAGVVWTVTSRAKRHDALRDLLRIYLRYVLAFTLLSYGMAKVIPTQFPTPTADRLMQPYGESSPMGILWTFMGSSTAYTIFAGAAEVLAAIPLLFRRTTLLGALLAAGVLTNVVMLNLCYDVPVKLYSTHLLLMACLLILPDAGRLCGFLILNRAVPSLEAAPVGVLARWRIVRWVGKSIMFLAVAINVAGATIGGLEFVHQPPKPLQGVSDVVEFKVDGQVRPPLTSDAERWRRLAFNNWGGLAIRRMDDSRLRYMATVNESARSVTLKTMNTDAPDLSLTYEVSSDGRLVLRGPTDRGTIEVTLSRQPDNSFLLLNRGFHWINEFPFNR